MVASSLAAPSLASSRLRVWHLPIPWLLRLAALFDCFRFGGCWLHDFVAAGVLVSGLVGGGFDGSGF